jgi:hypothetical protein
VPVQPNELGGDYHADVLSAGKHEGTVRSGDLILMKNSKELVEQKEEFYREQTRKMDRAYSSEYMQNQNSSMPVRDESKTSVTTGGGQKPRFEE